MGAGPLNNELEYIINQAIAEDIGKGDITTQALIPESQEGTASVTAKAKGIVAGTEAAKQVFLRIDSRLQVDILVKDGTPVEPGDLILKIRGKIRSILNAERVALNFLQHLSGIASETAHYVEAVKGLPVKIIDTRKTLPGLRLLEKYAIRMGGGSNHRMRLDDGILIKDNHLTALHSTGLNIEQIVAQAREKNTSNLKIEVEVISPEEAAEAANAGADIIMLDNMDPNNMQKAVQLINKRAIIEASGGVTLDNVRAIAETGVDLNSIGALTHSSRALDISLKLDR